jgi:hypothetical protein
LRRGFLNDLPHSCDYLPFEEDLALYFNNFWIPFTQGWFVPSFIEIGKLVLEKTAFKIDPTLSLHFCYYLPIEKDLVFYLNNFEFSYPRGSFVPSLIEIGLLVLKKILNNFHCTFTALLLSSPWAGTLPII